MVDADTLIQRLREAIYALGVDTVVCATDPCAENQRRLDERQAAVDAIIQEVADELVD